MCNKSVSNSKNHETQKTVCTPLSKQHLKSKAMLSDPCIRAENEDDDGYDPYSDRHPVAEPLFERDPWN